MSDEIELTREEKAAFQRLPGETKASDLLEERIVRSLKEEGIPGRQHVSGANGHPASEAGSSCWKDRFRP